MKTISLLFFLQLCNSLVSFAQVECISEINALPLYGEVEKCPQQVEADSIFLKEISERFDSINDAIQYHISEGWKYFYQGESENAIRRFNQAWLMDSLNAEIYWGLGNLLGMQQDYTASMRFLEKSIQLDSTNSKVWDSASINFGNLYIQTKEEKYLHKNIKYLKRSIQLSPTNGFAYARLTGAFAFTAQVDSALKYLRITDSMDSSLIAPDLRQYLDKN